MPAKIDKKEYGGKFIATKTFDCDNIVSANKDAEIAYNEAIAMGVEEPVINFIPEEGVVCLY